MMILFTGWDHRYLSLPAASLFPLVASSKPNGIWFLLLYYSILLHIYFLLSLTMPLFMIFPPIIPREGWRFVPLLRDRSVPKHFSWFIENGKFSFDYYYKIGVRTTQPQAALIMSKRRVKGVNYIITADDEEQSGTLKDGVIPWCRHWKQTRCAPKMERCANYERKKSQVPEYTNTNIIYMSLSSFFQDLMIRKKCRRIKTKKKGIENVCGIIYAKKKRYNIEIKESVVSFKTQTTNRTNVFLFILRTNRKRKR